MTTLVAGKLHGVHVTEATVNGQGSITLDPEHCEPVGFAPMEFVEIWNKTTGARTSAYVLLGERGSRCCIVDGAAARTCQPGDPLIICNPVASRDSHITDIVPRILTFDRDNHVIERLTYATFRDAQGRSRCSLVDEANVSQLISLVTAIGR
ncbi:aspartate 1-decarboxylase [Microvirga sp. VF16]|uniref:aspartate 1-decarboxylase n=1 Tax=Microvirga sp. VF16 TaxID=2807101 RepID=UPI00193DD4F7|nr:aspartate 1-decarboxylase [Microvirga sp. VF16]QRM32966.1 aspartate 1-decarboxylase [Microvirga sp. VF16]